MSNIKKLYSRFTISIAKNRTLLFFVAIQNTILTLLILMYANVIISNGKTSGELNYQQIRFFYSATMIILLMIPSIVSPYFLAGSINSMKKNNVIEYLLATKVKIRELIYATFFRGLATSIILLISAFPIACVSFFFGGVGGLRAIKLIIFLILYTVFVSATCIYISTLTKDSNLSTLIAYIILIFIFVIHIIYMWVIVDKTSFLFVYAILVIIFSIIFLYSSSKSRLLYI